MHLAANRVENRMMTGYIKSYIILPSTIWGIASGRMVDAKFQNPHSQQVPSLIKFAYARRAAGYVGAGMNVWPHISIDDGKRKRIILRQCSFDLSFIAVSNLYVEIYRQVIHESNEVPHGPSGFFNAENGKYQYKDLAQYIANALNVEDPIKFPSNNVIPFNEVEMKEKKVIHFFSFLSDFLKDGCGSLDFMDQTRDVVVTIVARSDGVPNIIRT